MRVPHTPPPGMRFRNIVPTLLSSLLLIACGSSNGQAPKAPAMSTNDMSQYDHSSNPHYSHTDTAKLNVPLSEWKKLLTEDLYYIAFEKGTGRIRP
jgi:major membrane immunogen (membrane-anchored lipoprotein)